MRRIDRSLVALAAVFACAAPAWAVPAVPPGAPWRTVAVCPLYATPGDPIGRVPHPAPPAIERTVGVLGDASGTTALVEARGWIEVGRPADALAALAAVSPDDPRARLACQVRVLGPVRIEAAD